MQSSSETIEKAIDYFSSLPSIGRKTAARLVYHLIKQPTDFLQNFSVSVMDLSTRVMLCSTCFSYSDNEECAICSSNKRNKRIICVVEDPKVINYIERTNEFKGVYHVLHGLLNPLEGITPNELKMRELFARAAYAEELILAISSSVEGEVTMQYIAKMLKDLNIKITRLASGLPMGTSLEHSDEATLSRAFENRIAV